MIAPAPTASYLLGQKLDSIPFSPYHVVLIVVLGIVGFVEGYDLALGGSLIGTGQRIYGPLGERNSLAGGRPDVHGRHRWLRGLSVVRPAEP